MRMRRFGLSAAALATLTAATFQGRARGDGPIGRDHPITIIASPSLLKEGSRCRVDVNELATSRRQSVVTTYEGVITKANEQGVGLDVIEKRQVVARPVASKLPLGGRLFRNIGIGRPSPDKKEQVWLPAESILSVKLAHQPPSPATASATH
jgi:hypothetical protein